jgi:SAM-dependent methyltransferase
MKTVAAVWHDVECGAYAADLSVWEEMATGTAGPVLELGCGTGRVALHLARRGHTVQGLDLAPELVAAFNARAAGLPASAEIGDARGFDLNRRFGLVLAPMQFIQLLPTRDERIACLSSARSHLEPGGRVAVAIAEAVLAGENQQAGAPPPGEAAAVLPDTQEVEGWVYSSLPLETVVGDEEILVRRLRQTVSPSGELEESLDDVRLQVLSSEAVEAEAMAAGLRPTGRRSVSPTDLHVGSTVVLLEDGS